MTWWRKMEARWPWEGAVFLGPLTTHHRISSSRLAFWGVSLSIQCPEFMGSWKVNISTDLFSFHPNGSRFWKCDNISEAAAQYMWSMQNGMENSSCSDVLPPSLICALEAGDPERAAAPLGATCLRCVRWVTRTPRQASGPPREGAAWGRPPARRRRQCCLTSESSSSSSSVKLYSSYQKFGLIYIYTNIYINIYLYTVILLN